LSARSEGGVLFVVGAFDDSGGLQRRIGRLANLFSRHRDVTVLTWCGARAPSWSRGPERLRVLRVPSLARWDRECRAPIGQLNVAASVASGVTATIALRRRWGAVYAAGLNPEGLVAALACLPLGRPFVVDTWLPGDLGNVARLERSPFRALLKRALGAATAIMAGTEQVAGELIGAGFPRSRVRLVRQGIPLAEFEPASAAERARERRRLGLTEGVGLVVFHGRFDLRQKRLDILLDGWRRASLDDWRLLLVGDGPGREEVTRRAHDLPSVLPTMPWRDDIRPVLAAADAFVLPTEAEATGTAMIEAMALGMAGVVSATEELERLGPPGIELVPNDPDAWARALRRLTESSSDRAGRGAKAREWVRERYDIEHTAATVESILDLA
jgi:glycosyltransferase involved in cell wall biosynthesis